MTRPPVPLSTPFGALVLPHRPSGSGSTGTSGSGCSRSVGTGSPRGSGRTVHRRKARRTASGTEGTSRR